MRSLKESSFAIIVAYYPKSDHLSRNCAVLSRSANVIIVDNTPNGTEVECPDCFKWISNRDNLGIATAQNIGIRCALTFGAERVAFFDQDSEISEDLLPVLLESLIRNKCKMVVPVCEDSRTKVESPSYKLNKIGWPYPIFSLKSPIIVKVDLAISSGSLITVGVFKEVGLMDDALFIDYVDFEWCMRLRHHGISIFVEPAAVMTQTIGDYYIEVLKWRTVLHSAQRSYYRVRNAFLLFRYEHVSTIYGIHEVMAAIFHHALQFPFSKNPSLHLKMGLKGIYDGIFR
jgi:rhamnosyltransferase